MKRLLAVTAIALLAGGLFVLRGLSSPEPRLLPPIELRAPTSGAPTPGRSDEQAGKRETKDGSDPGTRAREDDRDRDDPRDDGEPDDRDEGSGTSDENDGGSDD